MTIALSRLDSLIDQLKFDEKDIKGAQEKNLVIDRQREALIGIIKGVSQLIPTYSKDKTTTADLHKMRKEAGEALQSLEAGELVTRERVGKIAKILIPSLEDLVNNLRYTEEEAKADTSKVKRNQEKTLRRIMRSTSILMAKYPEDEAQVSKLRGLKLMASVALFQLENEKSGYIIPAKKVDVFIGMVIKGHFEKTPTQIKTTVASFLTPQDQARLAQASKSMSRELKKTMEDSFLSQLNKIVNYRNAPREEGEKLLKQANHEEFKKHLLAHAPEMIKQNRNNFILMLRYCRVLDHNVRKGFSELLGKEALKVLSMQEMDHLVEIEKVSTHLYETVDQRASPFPLDDFKAHEQVNPRLGRSLQEFHAQVVKLAPDLIKWDNKNIGLLLRYNRLLPPEIAKPFYELIMQSAKESVSSDVLESMGETEKIIAQLNIIADSHGKIKPTEEFHQQVMKQMAELIKKDSSNAIILIRYGRSVQAGKDFFEKLMQAAKQFLPKDQMEMLHVFMSEEAMKKMFGKIAQLPELQKILKEYGGL